MRATLERMFGSEDVSGRRIAVIGLGSVGGRLAELLHEGGAELVVADVDQSKRELAAAPRRANGPTRCRALTAEVDLIAPCALGGVLNDDTVPALRCKAIAGAANNQLADDSLEAADRRARHPLGARLRLQRGRHHQHLRRARARRATTPPAPTHNVRVVGDTLRTIFDSAAASDTTPLAAALELGRERLPAARRPSSRSFSRWARMRDRRELADVRGRVGPRGVEQLVLGRARPPPAPPAACARARRDGRGTRRASPPDR